MRAAYFVPIVLLLSGCFGGTGARPSPANYDLSAEKIEVDPGPVGMLRLVEVRSPSWLDTTAMQYRLAYAEKTRREAYAGSRWVAPPAGLLEQQLKRRLLAGGGSWSSQPAGCRLGVELDEFIQVFDGPASSHVVLDARATLWAARGDTPVARQRFTVSRLAGGDARSGAVALAAAAGQFGEDIGAWLRQAGGEALSHCRLS
ncbi:MAG: ABC-type transport auxiliary lipoprotein family protein [Sterolibacterium sp.]|jgi:cholesterol transport system auxiliary component